MPYDRLQVPETTKFHVKPLDETTWPDFARVVEKHNGVWGGCWCMSFHLERGFGNRTSSQNRAEKEHRVRNGRAHAALVYDGSSAVGWCQFGPADELPRSIVESYPEDGEGRTVSASFLHNGTVSMFEREGFQRSRRLGKNHWVVSKVVRKSSRRAPPAHA
jgi:hypothetical protein